MGCMVTWSMTEATTAIQRSQYIGSVGSKAAFARRKGHLELRVKPLLASLQQETSGLEIDAETADGANEIYRVYRRIEALDGISKALEQTQCLKMFIDH